MIMISMPKNWFARSGTLKTEFCWAFGASDMITSLVFKCELRANRAESKHSCGISRLSFSKHWHRFNELFRLRRTQCISMEFPLTLRTDMLSTAIRNEPFTQSNRFLTYKRRQRTLFIRTCEIQNLIRIVIVYLFFHLLRKNRKQLPRLKNQRTHAARKIFKLSLTNIHSRRDMIL